MRIALKLAYIGTNYHGFNIQPGVPTVEHFLFEALKSLDIFKNPKYARYSAGARTDRGVHALGQVISFDTQKLELTTPRIINSKLPEEMWIWARAEVDEDFDPRRDALFREYVYFLPADDIDLSTVKEASKILVGTHDFFNLSKSDGKRNTIRRIERIEVEKRGEFIVIEVSAGSFLWQMVRKIVKALEMVGKGEKDERWLKNLLERKIEEGIEPAPPWGLLLKRIAYEGVEFVEDEYSKKKAKKILEKNILWHKIMINILREME